MQTTGKIIAICGAKRSGKDTIAKYISSEYVFNHIKISHELKQICKILFNFSDDQLETGIKDVVDERWSSTPRKLMQFVGTDIMQYKINEVLPYIRKNFWINKTIQHMNVNMNANMNANMNNYVISDLRFSHEYEALKSTYDDALIIIKVRKNTSYANDNHISEKEWLDIPENYEVNNNVSIADLHKQIDNIIKSL